MVKAKKEQKPDEIADKGIQPQQETKITTIFDVRNNEDIDMLRRALRTPESSEVRQKIA